MFIHPVTTRYGVLVSRPQSNC